MHPLLIESGLFGGGLVRLRKSEDIARYNDALVDFGIAPTSLNEISIDGAGWSPEIALEKGNRRYMDQGEANQSVIIATPDQERLPIHVPAQSYERRLLANFFARSRREIADITTSACVRLHLEQGMTSFETPKDLLYLEHVVVQASCGKLYDEVATQKALATEFLSEGNQWFDAELRKRIIESGRTSGNLLRRRVEIPDFPFTLIGNFWHRAFGGVFVLQAGKDKILIVEDEKLLPGLEPERGERYSVFSIAQKKELIEHLLSEDLIEFDLAYYKEHPEELNELKNYIVADIVCRCEPDCDFAAMSAPKRKSVLVDSKDAEQPLLPSLERFTRTLSGKSVKALHMHEGLGLHLLRPSEKAGENAQSVLWMLLLLLQENPFNVLRLYEHDKERFFALFETWSASKKRWAARYVADRYVPEMKRTT